MIWACGEKCDVGRGAGLQLQNFVKLPSSGGSSLEKGILNLQLFKSDI